MHCGVCGCCGGLLNLEGGSVMTELKLQVESPEMAVIIIQVLQEMRSAQSKHPEWPEDNVKRAAIVLEEAGEVIREANLLDEGHGSVDGLKSELVQTAGTCLRHLVLLASSSMG